MGVDISMKRNRNINEPIGALSNYQLTNMGIGNMTKNMIAQNYRSFVMFFVFSLLFLTFNVVGVFAKWQGPSGGDHQLEGDMEKALENIRNEDDYWIPNVHER